MPKASKTPADDRRKAGVDALKKHEPTKDTILFSEEVKVGRLRFFKDTVARFEDPAMASYFDVCFNGTEFTDKEPAVVIGTDEINFDPNAPGETVDPHTVIGSGRHGIEQGTTVHQHLTGQPPGSDGTLEPHDADADTEA